MPDIHAVAFLRRYASFLLPAVLFLAAMFVLEHLNGRFWLNDFRVYWSAADALLHGQQVYGLPFGESTGFFKYSPFVAMLFEPFALLPFHVASVVWFWCIAGATIAVIIRLHRLLLQHIVLGPLARPNLLLVLSLLCVANHVVRELHLGNVNMMLLLLAVVAYASADQRPRLAGVLLAVLFMVKPYLCILVIPFLVRGHWKLVGAGVAAGVAMLALPVVFGFSHSFDLHSAWLQSMVQHGDYLTSGNTISSLLHRTTGVTDTAPLQVGIIALTMVVATILAWRLHKEGPMSMGNYVLFFGLLALVPNLVITDTQHFLLALPLFSFAIHKLAERRAPIVLALFIVICILHGANSSDLLGGELSDKVNAWGVLGVANLMLIALSARIACRQLNDPRTA
ncbi:MAG: DUF2029 domain-containing protein [Flavobacteriales bacterium]|nr:DUF2029 domain-containing protein [Flavobacteriales bacterium]